MPSHLAATLFTSGATARPRKVALTHPDLASAARDCIDWFAITAEDRMLDVLSCAHLQGLKGSAIVPAACGASVIAENGFDPDRFVAPIRGRRPTVFSAVPANRQSAPEAASQSPEALRPLALPVPALRFGAAASGGARGVGAGVRRAHAGGLRADRERRRDLRRSAAAAGPQAGRRRPAARRRDGRRRRGRAGPAPGGGGRGDCSVTLEVQLFADRGARDFKGLAGAI